MIWLFILKMSRRVLLVLLLLSRLRCQRRVLGLRQQQPRRPWVNLRNLFKVCWNKDVLLFCHDKVAILWPLIMESSACRIPLMRVWTKRKWRQKFWRDVFLCVQHVEQFVNPRHVCFHMFEQSLDVSAEATRRLHYGQSQKCSLQEDIVRLRSSVWFFQSHVSNVYDGFGFA